MLDSKESAKLVPTILSGLIKASLSYGSADEAFLTEVSPISAKIKPLKIT